MIIINYDTTQYYEYNVWDKYYTETIEKAEKKIIELMKEDWMTAHQRQDFKKQFNEDNQDNKNIHIDSYCQDLYITTTFDDLI